MASIQSPSTPSRHFKGLTVSGGAGGDRDPPKKPNLPFNSAPAQGKLSEAEKLNAQLRHLAQVADQLLNDVDKKNGRVVNPNKAWCLKIVEIISKKPQLLITKQKPAAIIQLWTDQTEESPFRIATEPMTLPDFSFNPHGGELIPRK